MGKLQAEMEGYPLRAGLLPGARMLLAEAECWRPIWKVAAELEGRSLGVGVWFGVRT